MKLKQMPLEEIRILPYTDLTYMILKENKKPMTTPEIFKEISNLLGYSEEDYANKIGDYYTSISLDKRFLMLDSGEWDVRDHHSIDLNVEEEVSDDESIDDIIEEDTMEDETSEEELDDVETPIEDDDIMDDDTDLSDLNIVIDEDEEELDDGDI